MIRRMNEDEIEARKRRGLHICIMSCNAMSYPPPPPHTQTRIHTHTHIYTHTYLYACMHIQTYQKKISPLILIAARSVSYHSISQEDIYRIRILLIVNWLFLLIIWKPHCVSVLSTSTYSLNSKYLFRMKKAEYDRKSLHNKLKNQRRKIWHVFVQ